MIVRHFTFMPSELVKLEVFFLSVLYRYSVQPICMHFPARKKSLENLTDLVRPSGLFLLQSLSVGQ